jgi:phosphatidylglycerol lysyltransferase
VLTHGWNATAYQILNPGMQLWFSGAGDAVAGFVQVGSTRVIAGAPVCTEARLPGVAAELERDSRMRGCSVLYFGAGSRLAHFQQETGRHSIVRIGAQPAWDPTEWDAIVAGKASLRAQLNRANNKGVVVEECSESPQLVMELRTILDEWLSFRGLPPLAFLVTPDLFGNLADRRLFVARHRGDAVAFLVATPVPSRRGWLVEEWPRRHRAPNGTTHLLVDAAMRSFASTGARYATLGLAPLSNRAGNLAEGHPRWLQLLFAWLRAHGTRFYNFRGLDAFKAGMMPREWEPIFVIAQGRSFPPLALRTIAGAFSDGSPEWLVARGLAAAARDEWLHFRRRLGRH